MYSTFRQSYILCSENGKLIFNIYSRYYFSFEQCNYTMSRSQRQQPTSYVTIRSFRRANCCQLNPLNRFLDGFPDPGQFAEAKLTHYSSKPQRPSDFSRLWLCILLSGDVHPKPGHTTKYPCPVCAMSQVVG